MDSISSASSNTTRRSASKVTRKSSPCAVTCTITTRERPSVLIISRSLATIMPSAAPETCAPWAKVAVSV